MGKAIYSTDQQKVIEKLIKARSESGLTQGQVAKKLGCTQSYISKIEGGQIEISVVLLQKLAILYKKDINYFL